MAISSFPAPADAGVLCLILANAAISIAIMADIFRSILRVVGICMESELDSSLTNPSTSRQHHQTPLRSRIAEFRARMPTTRYCSNLLYNCPGHECSICLMNYELRDEINCLPCAHVFHKTCIETWVHYQHATCPLCRDRLMPDLSRQ